MDLVNFQSAPQTAVQGNTNINNKLGKLKSTGPKKGERRELQKYNSHDEDLMPRPLSQKDGPLKGGAQPFV